jgi:hypothetical protein
MSLLSVLNRLKALRAKKAAGEFVFCFIMDDAILAVVAK